MNKELFVAKFHSYTMKRLAVELGMSVPTLRRRAAELGLKKGKGNHFKKKI